jgi:hypothetical protein
MGFPERVYTLDEYRKARAAIKNGHRHRLRLVGDVHFRDLVFRILDLIKLAGYDGFLRTYIKQICQIEGISQLRETESSVWMSNVVAQDSLEGARFVTQKTFQMKAYIEGRAWYFSGESAAIKESLEFLRVLKERLKDPELRTRCEKMIEAWTVDIAT